MINMITEYPVKTLDGFELLPEGAELITTNPDDMNRVKMNGRIELRHKELIPIGGNIVTQFQYKLEK